MSQDISGKTAVVAVQKASTRVWALDTDKHDAPIEVSNPGGTDKHVRDLQHGDHHNPTSEAHYFDAIYAEIKDAQHIVLIGHGSGKGNEMHEFVSYITKKHSDLVTKVSGQLELNIEGMTGPQLVAAARDFLNEPINRG